MNLKTALLPLLAILFLGGCEDYTQDEYREYFVVEAYLIAHGDMPEVRVTRTLPLGREYRISEAAVTDAFVQIDLLSGDGTAEKSYIYNYQSRGVYDPNFSDPVLPDRKYRLRVLLQNGDTVEAVTHVPGSFRTVEPPREVAVYQSEEQLEIVTTSSRYSDRPDRQSFMVFTVESQDLELENMTPFYRDILEQQEDGEIESYMRNSSGIINENTYRENSDGRITVKIPWLSFAFYEENDIIINMIDDNLYDFLRTQGVQTGGTTLPPGEIQNIDYNVTGGIGIFGSMASDTNRVFIRRNEM